MRVLQLIDSLEAGGAERMAVNLANGLASEIESSYLCTTRKEGILLNSLNPDVHYLFLNKTSTIDVLAFIRFYKYLKKEKITHLHAHSSSFFLATLVSLFLPRLQLIWHDHYGNSEFLEERPYQVLKWCSKRFNAVLSVNMLLVDWAQHHLKCSIVRYLPNFVDVKFEPGNLELPLYGSSGKRILCLANLRSQKGHLNLFKAFKEVSLRFPDWTLHCVGKDFKDAYSNKLKIKLRNLGLEHLVSLYGSRPDVKAIIAACDIGVLSSHSEGLPLALLEYGTGGLAVVATDVGDCIKVIPNSEYGQLVSRGDIDALVKALIQYIENPHLRKQHSLNLKKHISENFSFEAVFKQLKSVYQRESLINIR
ncbi:MAG: glycosyltransferase [Mangrovimonas sp.]|nr:glycosyltransferase [Mangrovimonas sp.]